MSLWQGCRLYLTIFFTVFFYDTGSAQVLGIDLNLGGGGGGDLGGGGSIRGTVNLGVCANRAATRFYNVAPNQQAATTGSISGIGYTLVEEHRDFCPRAGLHKYRTIDGTCNHARNLGASFTPLARFLPPAYRDGVKIPRTTGSDGLPLPSARNVSAKIHQAESDRKFLTLMVMQWGQWLDHDLTAVPVANEFDKTIKCCGENNGCPPYISNKECFPIELPAHEKNFAGSCMEFVRSIFATDPLGNELRPREQINSLTAFIDASNVYGSTIDVANYLRSGYLMRTSKGDLLPPSEEQDCILRPGTSDYCFVAGDLRVNVQPALAAMHTIWVREHNRIAHQIREYNALLSEEEVFQRTRKIIGALQQVITYNDWLPIILGPDANRLRLASRNGRSMYNPALDPRIGNAFAAAAFRFGHSLLPDSFPVGKQLVPLRNVFNRPALVFDSFDDLVAGIIGMSEVRRKPIQKFDKNFVKEITNHLFDPPTGPPGRGFDLVALNIQRGRDHGIPSYTRWRAFCGLRPLTGFDDTEALGPDVGDLATVYRSVDDIDLFTGAAFEPVDKGLLGPTYKCILGSQFFNLKYGDRFFFDTDNEYNGFNDAQLEALRNVTLAKVICANTRITHVPTNVFRFDNDNNNPLVSCRQLELEGLDLSLFSQF